MNESEEEEEVWLRDGVLSESNTNLLRRSNPDRIYEVLWHTEMFPQRGPHLKLHVLELNDGLHVKCKATDVMYEMDEGLWSQLSDDLIKRVLLRLPFVSQCRFRAVSKALRSALPESLPICAFENSSPLRNRLERQSLSYMSRILGVLGSMSRKLERPRRIRDGAEECFRSDRAAEEFARGLRDDIGGSQLRKIHQMDLSFAPSWITANRLRASRDGLLYMFSFQPPMTEGPSTSGGGLCILNPFTKTWRTLPPLPKLNNLTHVWQDCCEVMVDSASPSHFVVYIIVSGELEHGRNKFICQYSSSKANSWLIIPGDSEAPFRHESLCFTNRFLISWCDDRLSTYSLDNGNLLTSVILGDPPTPLSRDELRELREVERMEIVEHRGTIYGAMSLEVRVRDVPAAVTYLAISRLSTDMRWEEARIMPEWATSKSRMLEIVGEKEVPEEHWFFLDFTVAVLGDYICFKVLNGLVHGGNGRRVVSQNVVGFHIPSEEWRSFDLHIPHLLGATDLEVFEPKCLQVYL